MTSYRENGGQAFGAGVLGAFMMVAVLYLFQPIEQTRMDIALFLGSLVTGNTSTISWLIGFGMHLLIGGILGFVYGFILEVWGRSDWWRGIIISIPHSLIAGLVVGWLGHMHPLIPSTYAEPGFLGLSISGKIAFHLFVLNALYGAIVAAMYRVRPEHRGYFGLTRPVHA